MHNIFVISRALYGLEKKPHKGIPVFRLPLHHQLRMASLETRETKAPTVENSCFPIVQRVSLPTQHAHHLGFRTLTPA